MFKLFDKDSVLKHRNGGPFGLGDPNDQTIHLKETYGLVPAFEREILVRDYCPQFNAEYTRCCDSRSWTKEIVCRKEFSALKSCLKEFWDLPHLKKQAEAEYLAERTQYRLTGLKRSEREKFKSVAEKNQLSG